MYIHIAGPVKPVCHYSGTQVLDPFLPSDELTQDQAVKLLLSTDTTPYTAKAAFKFR